MSSIKKRLFFGLEATSPWPLIMPAGRLICENDRHATLAFLGNIDWAELSPHLKAIPSPSFNIGLGAILDKIMFLPHRRPNVVCWHADFFETLPKLTQYQNELSFWFKEAGFSPLEHVDKWLPHVSLARFPVDMPAWKKAFTPQPAIFKAIHLYESVGESQYCTLWSFPLLLPFEEIEHTADIAFIIKGETFFQVYLHALLALAFKFPRLLHFLG